MVDTIYYKMEMFIMSTMSVNFLSEKYELPANILQFIEYTKRFENYHEQLIQLTTRCMKQTADTEGMPFPDMDMFSSHLENIAKHVIAELSEAKVYDVSIDDLVKNNEGYKQLLGANIQALQKRYAALLSNIQTVETEYQRAYDQAANQVTGSGVLIWTSSLSSAFAYAAVESSIIKQQSNKANLELNATIQQINKRSDAQGQKAVFEIMFNYFYPEVQKSIACFISEAMEIFLNALERHGAFDYGALKQYNLPRSNGLLKNLEVVNDKEALFKQAFLCCPYNPDIFAKLIDYDIIDYDTFVTAKELLMADVLKEYILKFCGEHFTKSSNSVAFIKILSLFEEKDDGYVCRTLLSKQINVIQNRLNGILNIVDNKQNTITWIKLKITQNALELKFVTEEKCRELLLNTFYDIAPNKLMRFLIEHNILTFPAKCNFIVTTIKYDDIVEFISGKLLSEVVLAISKIINHSRESLSVSEKLKITLEEEEKLLKSELDSLNAKIKDLEGQLKQSKLFELSKKKQLKAEIESLQREAQNIKNNPKISELNKQYDSLMHKAKEIWYD